MATEGQELASLDFENLIGGPLIAVVRAQTQAAMATVDFIKKVGFKPAAGPQDPTAQATGEPAMIDFKYVKSVLKADKTGFEDKQATLTVPFLTILPIPNLRIEEVYIEFNAKINSTQYQQTDSSITVSAELEAKAGWVWGSARLKVNAAYQRQTKQGSTVTRDYSMTVKVKAVQEDMPAGMDRMMTILQGLITEKVAA